MGKKLFNFRIPHLRRMFLAVKDYEILDPVKIGTDRPMAVTTNRHMVAERPQKRKLGHGKYLLPEVLQNRSYPSRLPCHCERNEAIPLSCQRHDNATADFPITFFIFEFNNLPVRSEWLFH